MHGPAFVEEPSSSADYTNSSGIILNCSGQGDPPPEVRWVDAVNRDVYSMSGFREILPNGSLYIRPFSPSDFRPDVHSTVYKCVLSNLVGAVVSRESKIKAEVIQNMELQVPNVFATRGNVAVLKCGTDTGRILNFFSITWFRDSPDEGRTIVRSGGRYVETSGGELHVREVATEDSRSKFFCQLTNQLTNERYLSQPGHIVVTEANSDFAPRIDYFSPNVHVTVGSNAELVCVAEGHPPPVYRWFHEVSGILQEIRYSAAVFVRPQSSVLQFPRVQQSDSSKYMCTVSNVVGEDRREMRLSVLPPLIVFIRPQKLVVDSGSSAMFNCSVQGGIGDPIITWLKDGKQLYASHQVDILNKGETLMLNSIGRSDRGMYQCYARNGEDTAQASAELILGAVAPELEGTFGEETLQPGSSVSLRCIASGNPPPRITWSVDGFPVQTDEDYIIGSFADFKGSVVSHLNVSNMRTIHGGLYSCVAKNFLGFAEYSALINVYGLPTARSPLNITAVSGTTVVIRCPVAGFPVTRTSWNFGNSAVYENTRHKPFQNGTLMLNSVEDEKDQGKYRCHVTNQHGQSADGVVYLNIMNAPEIMPFYFSSTLKEGSKAHVACTVVAGDLPVTFTWRKDGKLITNSKDVEVQNMEMVSTLRINDLSGRHSGLYTCIATNPATSSNYTAKLVVKASPSWKIEPQDTIVLHHQSVTIDCQAEGHPVPHIKWKRVKGSKSLHYLELEQDSKMTMHRNGSLTISSADQSHEGHYECVASNGIGSSLSKVIFLKVNVPAHFRIKSMNQSGIASEVLILHCEAEGDLPLRLTWSTPSSFVPQTKHTTVGSVSELRIEHLNRNHSGLYRCTASNSFGYDHLTIYVTVKDTPKVLTGLQVKEVRSRWISVEWSSDNETGLYYVVQIKPDHETVWINTTVKSVDSERRTTISSLTPYTNYSVRLFAVNEVGFSPPSDPITVRTLQEVPGLSPEEIQVWKVSSTRATITWKTLDSKSWNGNPVGYRVVCVESGQGVTSPRTRTVLGEGKNEAVLFNLQYYTLYEVTVRAFNELGEGPPSPVIHFTTLEGVPSVPPQNVRCIPVSSTSIRVIWDPPPSQYWNGILQSYKVSYTPVAKSLSQKLSADSRRTTNLQLDVYSLQSGTNYSIKVAASSNAGEGLPSVPTSCSTSDDVPGPPEDIKAIVVTSDRILVTWKPPEQAQQIIKYNIYMSHELQGQRKESLYRGQKNKFEFRHLKEYGNYEFWVTAFTSAGEGESSYRVMQRPVSRVPARIGSFSDRVIGIEGNSLTLDCITTGLPAPVINWFNFSTLLSSSDTHRLLPNGSLHIQSLKFEHSGNYSCVAENVFGKDSIVYSLRIVTTPSAPVFRNFISDEKSILVTWHTSYDGGSTITGFLLHYESSLDSKRTIHVDSNMNELRVHNLHCGVTYSFTIQSINSVDASVPSDVFEVSTKGAIPEIPAETDIMFVNSTNVVIYLDAWPVGICPVVNFKVAYKLKDTWIPVGGGFLPIDQINIPELLPTTLYTVRIAAYNDAGMVRHDFTFITRALNGDVVPVELFKEQGKNTLTYQFNFVLPLVSSILCVSFLCLCVLLFAYRKKIHQHHRKSENMLEHNKVSFDSESNKHKQPYSSPRSEASQRSENKEYSVSDADYDIYPYATFVVPDRLQTYDIYDTTTKEGSISRRHRRYTKPQNNELGISYISNQPTLPSDRKLNCNKSFVLSINAEKEYENGEHIKMKQFASPTDYETESSESDISLGKVNQQKKGKRLKKYRRRTSSLSSKLPRKSMHSSECSDSYESSSMQQADCRPRMQHQKLNEELSSIVSEYRQRRPKPDDYMIHV